VRILSPHNNAHIGPTLVVRVAVTGGDSSGGHAVLYRLDHQRIRRGGDRLVLHHLSPGRHHLRIAIAGDARATATLMFVVPRPAPTVTPQPAAVASPATATASATTTAPTTTAAPTSTTTSAAAAPTTSSPPATAIPQHNGGDRDSDNNGGPTDGDGNI
jgi:hypothetical protein